jgi:hypothetical protein
MTALRGYVMFVVDTTWKHKKDELLDYFRSRIAESLDEIQKIQGTHKYREQATAVNRAIAGIRNTLISALTQTAAREEWYKEDILECVLMVTYVSYVVMIETRNEVWPYDYMSFSRRVGELWELFCKLCFEIPLSDAVLFVPPLFSEVRQKLTDEVNDYIDQLNITQVQKDELRRYYSKVWSLVTSGEIRLELDLHFKMGDEKYVVDFKSGFGSNEKGNTNRLLLVATIYKNLEENFNCLLLVRAEEDKNNAYFQILKNSGIWKAYCGDEAYARIKEYSGFDIKRWINQNVNWQGDFLPEAKQHIEKNNLDHYLAW